MSAEASSILQTPIIHRKTTPRTHVTSPRPTPQSILKVRQISNKSPSMHSTSPLSIGDKGKVNFFFFFYFCIFVKEKEFASFSFQKIFYSVDEMLISLMM